MPPQPADVVPYWTIIIPVKDTSVAKSRLRRLDKAARSALATAFALDVATAAVHTSQVARVVAVTNDADASRALRAIGTEIVADAPRSGQNAALLHAFDVVRSDDAATGVAALSADLPALRSEDLDRALRAAARLRSWFVADAEGTGTTLLGAAAGTKLVPAFGGRSRDHHRRLGAAEITVAGLERLRRDVDTESDLAEAMHLGLGAHTRAAVAVLDLVCTR